MKIQDEIRQSKFKNQYQKAALNVLFTASWMNKINSDALKDYKISIQQFNVLRILRGMHPKPASVKILTERMLDKMSNASRLVDKLIAKKLVVRKACPGDRRQVDVFITELGMKTVEEASITLEDSLFNSVNGITEEEAALLSDLLDRMRR